MTEIVKELREIIVAVVPVIVSIIFLASMLTKSKKLRKLSDDMIKIETVIKEYMTGAEEFLNFSGKEKKEWVKTKVNQYCIENGIPYADGLVDDLIENLIYLTKNVNKREKDKEVL